MTAHVGGHPFGWHPLPRTTRPDRFRVLFALALGALGLLLALALIDWRLAARHAPPVPAFEPMTLLSPWTGRAASIEGAPAMSFAPDALYLEPRPPTRVGSRLTDAPPLSVAAQRGAALSSQLYTTAPLSPRSPTDEPLGAHDAERVVHVEQQWHGEGAFTPDGLLSPGDVTDGILQRKGALVAAYEHALNTDPSLAGQVWVRFTITRSGAVRDVEIIRDDLSNAELAVRITHVIAGWRFPAPSGESVQVVYPFTFEPRSR